MQFIRQCAYRIFRIRSIAINTALLLLLLTMFASLCTHAEPKAHEVAASATSQGEQDCIQEVSVWIDGCQPNLPEPVYTGKAEYMKLKAKFGTLFEHCPTPASRAITPFDSQYAKAWAAMNRYNDAIDAVIESYEPGGDKKSRPSFVTIAARAFAAWDEVKAFRRQYYIDQTAQSLRKKADSGDVGAIYWATILGLEDIIPDLQDRYVKFLSADKDKLNAGRLVSESVLSLPRHDFRNTMNGRMIRIVEDAAEMSDPASMCLAGYLAAKETGKRRAVGIKYLERASDAGQGLAELTLGTIYTTSRVPSNETARGIALLQSAANKGVPGAAWRISLEYWLGELVPKNKIASITWVEKAAEEGDSDAMYWIGSKYLRGEGVDKNPLSAYRWLSRGADLDHSHCQFLMAMESFTGQVFPKNIDTAKAWMDKCSDDPNLPQKAMESLKNKIDNAIENRRQERMAAGALQRQEAEAAEYSMRQYLINRERAYSWKRTMQVMRGQSARYRYRFAGRGYSNYLLYNPYARYGDPYRASENAVVSSNFNAEAGALLLLGFAAYALSDSTPGLDLFSGMMTHRTVESPYRRGCSNCINGQVYDYEPRYEDGHYIGEAQVLLPCGKCN